MPGGGATRRLPARFGYSGALRFILQDETLTGTEAFTSGLVDETVPTGKASRRGGSMAAALAELPPSVVHGIRSSLRAAAPPVMMQTETAEFQRSVLEGLVTG